MTTKEAQRAADAAWRKRLKESGGAHLSVTVSAEGLQALNALTGGDNRKRSETVNAALIAAAEQKLREQLKAGQAAARKAAEGRGYELDPRIAAAKAAQKPMTGFMATLTPEQKEAALAYRGDDTHGDPEFAAQKPVEPSKPQRRLTTSEKTAKALRDTSKPPKGSAEVASRLTASQAELLAKAKAYTYDDFSGDGYSLLDRHQLRIARRLEEMGLVSIGLPTCGAHLGRARLTRTSATPKTTKPKLDTSAVMVHPSLKKEKPDGR